MNHSVTRITLDVSVQEKQACISIRQFDTMRRFVFSLVDKGLPYILEKGVFAYLSVRTPTETYVFGGCVIQDGAVHFDVPASMTLEPGENECELIISAVDHRVLTTCGFDVIVFSSTAADYSEDAIASNDFFAMIEATNAANDIARILNEKLENGEFKGEKGDPGETGVIYEGKITTSGENVITGDLGSNPPLFLGAKYKVVYDGTEYETDFQSNGSYSYLGNGHMLMSSIEDTGEPFCVARAVHTTMLVALTAEEHELTIVGNALPEVSSDDNGKVPQVVGGVWGLSDPIEVGGGSELPEITEEDEGKILTAKGGQAVWGDAPTWEDIEDAPFGEVEVPGELITLEWDADTEGRPFVVGNEEDRIIFYKVSDDMPDPTAFIGCEVISIRDGTRYVGYANKDDIYDWRTKPYPDLQVGGFGTRIMVFYDIVEQFGNTETGIYFYCADENNYFKSITYEGKLTEIKKLDKKYLPDDLASEIIHEVSSPDEIDKDAEDGFYVVPNGESDEDGGGSTGGGSTGGGDTSALEGRVVALERDVDELNGRVSALEQGGGSGGESDDGGEESVSCGETLTWDGTPTLAYASVGQLTYYRVSDSTPTVDEMAGGLMNTLVGATVMPADVTASSMVQLAENVVGLGSDSPRFIVAYANGAAATIGGNTFTFPKSGIYFFISVNDDGSTYARSRDLTVEGYNFTKITVKPSGGTGGGFTLPVVELETLLSNGATLSDSDITKMTQLNGDLFIAKCNISDGEGGGIPMTLMFSSALAIEGMFLYSAISNSTVLENICIGNLEGVWGVNIAELYT